MVRYLNGLIVYQMGRLCGEAMKYQALRPQFFSVGGWVVVQWVGVGSGGVGWWWVGVGGGGRVGWVVVGLGW